MSLIFEAIYENGVLKPLRDPGLYEHERVVVNVERARGEEDASSQLAAWHEVYSGLSESDIAEVEAIALDRSHFFRRESE
ncbi:MAG TPA: antitoxin family protein [Thermoanaerobaculia bacterium]|nr:antitoxin family protein [Thermoanaerobaculia bacterium]